MLEEKTMSKTLCAVYGSLKTGLHNHVILDNSKKLGDVIIGGFEMYSLGAFPAITESNVEDRIFAEVYEVTEGTFARLDILEGYPNFYNRKKVDTPLGEAWIYFIKNTERFTDSRRVLPKEGVPYASWRA